MNVDEEEVVATWVNPVIKYELKSRKRWVMLEDGNGVESLDFKSKLEELLDGLGDFVKEKEQQKQSFLNLKRRWIQTSHALTL